MEKMNILYLHTHDCGRFISPYGYDMPTPNCMKFAKEGTVFRQACCASPTCSPSRAALLTGQYGHVNGMMGLSNMDGFELNDIGHHMVSFLKRYDYECAVAGIYHISFKVRTELGYDRVLTLKEPSGLLEELDSGVTADLSTEEAVDRYLKEDHDKPFFLSVGYGAPHRYGKDRRLFNKNAVYIPPEAEESKYARPLPIYPDNPVSRSETANFQAGTKIMDDQFGAILSSLERSRYADNTLVVMTTDHGAGMPGMKCTLTDWGIGVFLMLRGPGIPAGAVLDSMVSHVDIFPTLTDYLGLERPDWLQGKSLMPLLHGEQDEVNDYIYAEQGYHGSARPLRAIRSSRYKLIRCYKTDRGEDHYCSDAGPMFDYWMEQGLHKRPVTEYALYDLIFDPMERCNQADNPAYKEVFEDLKERLDRFMRKTNDPLVSGKLPLSPVYAAKLANGELVPED